MSQEKPIRILIADDSEIIRDGLVSMLEIKSETNMKVVGQAKNGREVVEMFAQLKPDIALIDLEMPQMDGMEAIKAIRDQFNGARLIVLTNHKSYEYINLLRSDAKAYLLKGVHREELLACIREVYAGHRYISPEVGNILWKEGENIQKLSKRELEVLNLIAEGMNNSEIGCKLCITEGTVKSHVNSILSKLEVSDRTNAIITALKRGIISLW